MYNMCDLEQQIFDLNINILKQTFTLTLTKQFSQV